MIILTTFLHTCANAQYHWNIPLQFVLNTLHVIRQFKTMLEFLSNKTNMICIKDIEQSKHDL